MMDQFHQSHSNTAPSDLDIWLQKYMALASFHTFSESFLAVFDPFSASPGAGAPPGRSLNSRSRAARRPRWRPTRIPQQRRLLSRH